MNIRFTNGKSGFFRTFSYARTWYSWIIVTRNGKKVWKHRPNWPFYALMLRTKLYQNPFFFNGHQNINKHKSRAARTVHGPTILPFYKINIFKTIQIFKIRLKKIIFESANILADFWNYFHINWNLLNSTQDKSF